MKKTEKISQQKMSSRNPVLYTILLMLLVVCHSCSVNKYIPKNELLYTGAELKTQYDTIIKNHKKIEEDLSLILTPVPNSKILGTRLGLYYHYKAQKKKPGLINKWLNKKFGEKPVYLSDVNTSRIEDVMRNRLENKGFFYSSVTSKIDSTEKHASLEYTVNLPKPYQLEHFKLDNDSLPIYNDLVETLKESKIKESGLFDLDLMKAERERIDAALKRKGYYNFNPDFLVFEADTNRYKNKKFDLFLRLKKNVPEKALVPYIIDSITVFPNFSVNTDSIPTESSSIDFKDLTIVQKDEFFEPKRLEPYILFKKGQKYDSEKSRLTANRLSSIGSYKFVNIRFKEKDSVPTDSTMALDADIYLSPLTKRSLRAELQAVTRSNGFAGPGIAVTYNNRNLFKGGETLSLTGSFAYESQLAGGDNTGLTSIAGGIKADLTIPRLVPFSTKLFNYAVPKTKISLGTDILQRSRLYTLNSLNTSFGYTWQQNKFVNHVLNPVAVNSVNLSRTSDEFEDILDNNPFLRSSFEQQFIVGLNYTFTYNELIDEDKTQPIFFSTGIDIAGNSLSLLSGGKSEVFGLEYAQFAKVNVDFRYYFRWGKEQSLVSRLFAGWGVPYGNSNTLPFVKQFFSGGPYSVRAFQIRSLGPGTFSSNTSGTTSFFDQSGNLRLEANLEYRFPVYSYLKGAIFADAGNVWLTTNEVDTAGESEEAIAFNETLSTEGKFDKDWPKELGVGVGFGLRLDIQSFVIRVDLASPLQVPSLPEGNRIRVPFFDGGSNNLVLNFAIGYPF